MKHVSDFVTSDRGSDTWINKVHGRHQHSCACLAACNGILPVLFVTSFVLLVATGPSLYGAQERLTSSSCRNIDTRFPQLYTLLASGRFDSRVGSPPMKSPYHFKPASVGGSEHVLWTEARQAVAAIVSR
ncbi:hypothetical protein BDW22DRAFT_58374 [Trametopsis cervina]|nr:hypothetical protein BDW22DRAFT_58374 [Trametopsis cervina]